MLLTQFSYADDVEQKNKYIISCVQMFKTGISPMWEDDANKKGGEWRLEIKQHTTENLQKIWERLVFDMITGNMPHCKEGVAGVRLNQKQKNF